MNKNVFFKLAGASALALISASASAHVGADASAHHDVLTGFMHPLSGLDHLATMLAVGIWSAVTTRRVWAAPLAFAALLLLGALLAQAGLVLPLAEPMIVASTLVLGLLLACRQRLPDAVGALLVGGFALFHGAAHGQELSGFSPLLGMVAATAVLHAAGLGLGLALKQQNPWLARAAGAVVAFSGLGLAWSLVGA